MSAPRPYGMHIVQLCEQELGWVPDPAVALWRARMVAAGRLNQAIKKDPLRLTRRNLELAVALLRRERQPIASPMLLVHKVDEAVKAAAAEPQQSVSQLMEAAVAQEMGMGDARASFWIGRLTRAAGSGRTQVYEQWRAERAGA